MLSFTARTITNQGGMSDGGGANYNHHVHVQGGKSID